MSYPRGLDEFSDKELRDELKKRLMFRHMGLCDYCERPLKAEMCRFPDRHRILRGLHSGFEIRRPKAGSKEAERIMGKRL